MAAKRRSAAKSAPRNEKPSDADEKPSDADPTFVKLARAREEGWARGVAEGFARAWAIAIRDAVVMSDAITVTATGIAAEAIRCCGDEARRELRDRGWDGDL